MKISEEYRELNRELHERTAKYGAGGHRLAKNVRALADELDVADILDYGCGKATLAKALPDLDVSNYDPAIHEYSADPAPASIVVCSDVLEHVEPEAVDEVLEHIALLTKRNALLVIACRPASKFLADGRNAHLSVHPPRWWCEQVVKYMDIGRVRADAKEVVILAGPKRAERRQAAVKPTPGVTPIPDIMLQAIEAQCRHVGDYPWAALNNSAFEAMSAGEYEIATTLLRRAISMEPGNKTLRDNLATCLKHMGREDETLAIYRQLIAENPDFIVAHNNIATTLLRRGEFKDGWHYYAWRLKAKRRFARHREPLTGRFYDELPTPSADEVRAKGIYLLPEQGLGDELFFLRFVPRLIERFAPAQVWYTPTPKLRPILKRSGWPLTVAEPEWIPTDTPALPIGNLPPFVGHASDADIPPVLPLAPRGRWWWRWAIRRPVRRPSGSRRWLGVTWESGIRGGKHRGMLHKRITPSVLGGALRDVEGEVLVIQRGLEPADLESFRAAIDRDVLVYKEPASPAVELEHLMRTLADLDEYVGVTNTNVYLLHAMGRRARVLLPFPPVWRWTDKPGESPWFPGLSTYREEVRRGWVPALEQLAADLRR